MPKLMLMTTTRESRERTRTGYPPRKSMTMTPEQRALQGATLRIRRLSREARSYKKLFEEQLEKNRRLTYDLHQMEVVADLAIKQLEERVQELMAQSDVRSDEVVALQESKRRLEGYLDDANDQIKNLEHQLGLATGRRGVLMKSNQALSERCDKLDMRIGILIDTVFILSQP